MTWERTVLQLIREKSKIELGEMPEHVSELLSLFIYPSPKKFVQQRKAKSLICPLCDF